jgi:hypothetical protein
MPSHICLIAGTGNPTGSQPSDFLATRFIAEGAYAAIKIGGCGFWTGFGWIVEGAILK